MMDQLFKKKSTRSSGQALVEFTLILPLILLVVMGLLDFGRILFAYSQGSGALRDSLRYAEVLGVYGGTTPSYLNCSAITEEGTNNFFANSQTIDIKYYKASTYNSGTKTYGTVYTAGGGNTACQNASGNIENGDLLYIELTVTVKPLFLPIDPFQLKFHGQRTIIAEILMGAGEGDTDQDGLLDTWEELHFTGYCTPGMSSAACTAKPWLTADGEFNLKYMSSQDDPDGDSCNNGCEESASPQPTGTDPTDSTSLPALGTSDNDSDGVLNADDDCPGVFGTGADGCPVDTDSDGVADNLDNCPSLAGDETAEGCPDADEDGFRDDDGEDKCVGTPGDTQGCLDADDDGFYDDVAAVVDKCPGVQGYKDGCASDGDSDGFRDDNGADACPSVAGSTDGCPDEDGDGFHDDIDQCLGSVGTAAGCPDGDGDSIRNTSDTCPTAAGVSEFNGCPDADDDNFHEGDSTSGVAAVDKCPTVYGTLTTPADKVGCPDPNAVDGDNDGIGDVSDTCPAVFGTAEFSGCPDNDLDHIRDDTVDQCDTVAGTVEFSGCPDTDLDHFRDDTDDLCDNDFGTVLGCDDTDGDGYADVTGYDYCLNNAGTFDGCKDVDNDLFGDYAPRDQCIGVRGFLNGCPDTDSDNVIDKPYGTDNCPGLANPAPQTDSDGDGIGDPCDTTSVNLIIRIWTNSDDDACNGEQHVGTASDQSTLELKDLTSGSSYTTSRVSGTWTFNRAVLSTGTGTTFQVVLTKSQIVPGSPYSQAGKIHVLDGFRLNGGSCQSTTNPASTPTFSIDADNVTTGQVIYLDFYYLRTSTNG